MSQNLSLSAECERARKGQTRHERKKVNYVNQQNYLSRSPFLSYHSFVSAFTLRASVRRERENIETLLTLKCHYQCGNK
jgi:hypothetical protein